MLFKCTFEGDKQSNSLTHHGIKGMKWGVRKSDGLSPAGGGGIDNEKSSDEEDMEKKSKDLDDRYRNGELSTEEYVIAKMNLNTTYGKPGTSKGKHKIEEDVKNILGLNDERKSKPLTNSQEVQKTERDQQVKKQKASNRFIL